MAEAVRSGETTAEELTTAALDRIDAWDGDVHAFTVVLREEALARAREIDAGGSASLGPLGGVPVSVKDHIWMAGQAATNGSVALRDFVPDVDAVPVARLRAAGAVVVGRTNNPEFCYRGYTQNALFGLTRNPWALDHTPGGSSGGAGASVAYGATPVALGTDGGGSIRIPAAFCGLVGHKPTFGLVPKLPGFRGWPTLSVDGPLTATVRDAALTLGVLAGSRSATRSRSTGPGSGWRCPRTWGGLPSSPSSAPPSGRRWTGCPTTAPGSRRRIRTPPIRPPCGTTSPFPRGSRRRGRSSTARGSTRRAARSSRRAAR
jgi:Asp-tRNA(Asn)/Glu-tRNA(Gln) amidotransferase A subunit family amidase